MTTRAGTRATVGRGRDSHDLIRVHGARENDQHRDPAAPADGVQRRFRLGQDFPANLDQPFLAWRADTATDGPGGILHARVRRLQPRLPGTPARTVD